MGQDDSADEPPAWRLRGRPAVSDSIIPLPECAGLELTTPQCRAGDPAFDLNVELTLGDERSLSDGRIAFSLGFRRVWLELALTALQLLPDSLLGKHDRTDPPASEEMREQTTRIASGREVQIQAKAALQPGAAPSGQIAGEGKLGRGRANEETRHSKSQWQEQHHRVRFRGTSHQPRWVIDNEDPPATSLKDRYLGEDNLGRCQPTAVAGGLAATVTCDKRDLQISDLRHYGLTPRTKPWSWNTERLAYALIAKRLATATGSGADDQALTLCRAELSYQAQPVSAERANGDA